MSSRADELLQNVRTDREAVATLYARFDPQNDARITAFGRLEAGCVSLHLAFMFLALHLTNIDWWEKYPDIEPEDQKNLAERFQDFAKLGFFHGFFSVVESSLRALLRGIDANACNGGTGPFANIYSCLFARLASPPPQGIALLDFARHVRNTIHNNGVYFDENGEDRVVDWRGKQYHFKHGYRVKIDWDLIIDVADSLRTLLRSILEDSKLLEINHQITDPFTQTVD